MAPDKRDDWERERIVMCVGRVALIKTTRMHDLLANRPAQTSTHTASYPLILPKTNPSGVCACATVSIYIM